MRTDAQIKFRYYPLMIERKWLAFLREVIPIDTYIYEIYTLAALISQTFSTFVLL